MIELINISALLLSVVLFSFAILMLHWIDRSTKRAKVELEAYSDELLARERAVRDRETKVAEAVAELAKRHQLLIEHLDLGVFVEQVVETALEHSRGSTHGSADIAAGIIRHHIPDPSKPIDARTAYLIRLHALTFASNRRHSHAVRIGPPVLPAPPTTEDGPDHAETPEA